MAARLLSRHIAFIGLGIAAVVQSCGGGSDAGPAQASGGNDTSSGGSSGTSTSDRGGKAGSAANSTGGAGGVPALPTPDGGAFGEGGTPSVPGSGEGGKATTAGASSVGTGGHVNMDPMTGNEAGSGGAAPFTPTDPVIYDFEVDAETWTADADVSVRASTERALTGAQSLALDLPPLAADAKRQISVFNPPMWPGTNVTFYVFSPAGADSPISARAFARVNNDDAMNMNGSEERLLKPGAWTALNYTIPSTFPGGLQDIGVELTAANSAYAGGTVYLDTVTANGGVADCSGTGTGFYDFSQADVANWQIDKDSVGNDFSIESSTDRARPGGPSMKVTFSSMAPPEPGQQTIRKIVLNRPDAYCGQEISFSVWVPLTSDKLIIQAFTDYDNGATDVGTLETLFRNGWSVFNYTLPPVDTGGIQRIGVQFAYFGDVPYSDSVFIDDLAW